MKRIGQQMGNPNENENGSSIAITAIFVLLALLGGFVYVNHLGDHRELVELAEELKTDIESRKQWQEEVDRMIIDAKAILGEDRKNNERLKKAIAVAPSFESFPVQESELVVLHERVVRNDARERVCEVWVWVPSGKHRFGLGEVFEGNAHVSNGRELVSFDLPPNSACRIVVGSTFVGEQLRLKVTSFDTEGVVLYEKSAPVDSHSPVDPDSISIAYAPGEEYMNRSGLSIFQTVGEGKLETSFWWEVESPDVDEFNWASKVLIGFSNANRDMPKISNHYQTPDDSGRLKLHRR